MKYVVDSVFFRSFKHFIYLFFSYLYYFVAGAYGENVTGTRTFFFYCYDNVELSTEPDILFFNWINDDTYVLFKQKMFILILLLGSACFYWKYRKKIQKLFLEKCSLICLFSATWRYALICDIHYPSKIFSRPHFFPILYLLTNSSFKTIFK